MARQRTKGIEATTDELTDLEVEGVDFTRIGVDESPTDLNAEDFISGGSSLLDLAVSNRPNAGIITCGRIMELQGLEGSGKSLVCAHMIANVQKEGGVAVLFDSEYAVNEEFFKAVGVDFTKLKVVNNDEVNKLEYVFDTIEKIITSIRQKNRNRKVLIVVDSLTALKPASELEGDMEKEGYGTKKAKFLSDNLPRINNLIANQKIALVFTQQLRQKMNVMSFADPWTTSGGKALPFYASVRIRFSQKGQIKVDRFGEKETVGIVAEAKVIKNRLGPPYRKVEFDIYFDRGIDDVSSWLRVLKKRELIKGTGKKYTFTDAAGKDWDFSTASWKQFTQENPDVFTEIYNKLADTMITAYRTDDLSTVDGSAEIEEGTTLEE